MERDALRIGLSFRVAGLIFRALCACGMASGEEVETCVGESILAEIDRFGGCSRDGESGELGEGDVDFEVTRRKVGPLEGDLESDRRSCLNAAAGST